MIESPKHTTHVLAWCQHSTSGKSYFAFLFACQSASGTIWSVKQQSHWHSVWIELALTTSWMEWIYSPCGLNAKMCQSMKFNHRLHERSWSKSLAHVNCISHLIFDLSPILHIIFVSSCSWLRTKRSSRVEDMKCSKKDRREWCDGSSWNIVFGLLSWVEDKVSPFCLKLSNTFYSARVVLVILSRLQVFWSW